MSKANAIAARIEQLADAAESRARDKVLRRHFIGLGDMKGLVDGVLFVISLGYALRLGSKPPKWLTSKFVAVIEMQYEGEHLPRLVSASVSLGNKRVNVKRAGRYKYTVGDTLLHTENDETMRIALEIAYSLWGEKNSDLSVGDSRRTDAFACGHYRGRCGCMTCWIRGVEVADV